MILWIWSGDPHDGTLFFQWSAHFVQRHDIGPCNGRFSHLIFCGLLSLQLISVWPHKSRQKKNTKIKQNIQKSKNECVKNISQTCFVFFSVRFVPWLHLLYHNESWNRRKQNMVRRRSNHPCGNYLLNENKQKYGDGRFFQYRANSFAKITNRSSV